MNDVQRYEDMAEAAYQAMYDAASGPAAKSDYEDACLYFSRAAAAARQLGRPDEAARLGLRLEHVRSVYNHQFRWV